MGFGFNFFLIFILLPLSLILLVTWLFLKKNIIAKTLIYIWTGVILIIIVSIIFRWLTSKKELTKKDYYGTFIIHRDYFKGKQADWQYQTFRFEIKENDSIFFYVTNKEEILKTYRGKITTLNYYNSERLIVNMEQPTHHIMIANPTTFRSNWSYYLVFHSPKFNNVFFKKGKWTPIND